jgi:uncharacterized protein (DUF1330 family)
MPKGYILAEVNVTDPEVFDAYRPLAQASVERFGGKYLVRGGPTRTLEGERMLSRLVLLEFPSPERAIDWYNSAEYRAAVNMRLKSADTEVFLLTGHED